jgi:hypothetical protein
MILAIVGSCALTPAQQAHARWVIDLALDKHQPAKVVSGGAVGIDTLAETAAHARGIDFEKFLPKTNHWEDGFKPRNILIAEACTQLLRIVTKESRTYGSGWTRDYAKNLGKPTLEVVI